MTSGGQLLRIEPTTGAVTTRNPVGFGEVPHDVVAADDGVLVLVRDIWVVDPETTRLDRTIGVGGYVTAAADEPGPGFWAVTSEGTLARLDPELPELPLRRQLGRQPVALAIASGAVWVTIAEPEY